MPSQRGLDSRPCGLSIAHLADHDHVGILTQEGAQGIGEGKANSGLDLGLADPVDLVFNRILDGQESCG